MFEKNIHDTLHETWNSCFIIWLVNTVSLVTKLIKCTLSVTNVITFCDSSGIPWPVATLFTFMTCLGNYTLLLLEKKQKLLTFFSQIDKSPSVLNMTLGSPLSCGHWIFPVGFMLGRRGPEGRVLTNTLYTFWVPFGSLFILPQSYLLSHHNKLTQLMPATNPVSQKLS